MTATTTAAGVRTFTIDKAHSEVTFQVRHLVTRIRGRFADFAGTVLFDPARPELSSVALTIQAASVDTNTADGDRHLRSDDFFAVEKFPTISAKRRIRGATRASAVEGEIKNWRIKN